MKKYAELWVPFWKHITKLTGGKLGTNQTNVQLEMTSVEKPRLFLKHGEM